MRTPALRHALSWGGLLVSAAFAYLAVRDVDFSEVWEGLRTSNYWWLLPALGLLAVTVYVKAIRWRYLFAHATRPPTRAVVRALLIGYFFNAILPARAGEAARVLALKQRAGTSRAESAGTVVIERAYDVIALLVLLFVAAPWFPRVTWLDEAVVLALVLGLGLAASIVVLAVYGLRPVHYVLKPLVRLPFLSRERVEHVGVNLGQGLAAVRRPRLVVAALFWTTLGWLTLSASVWFVMLGFDLGLSLFAALLVVIATNVAMIIPSSPSGVGVFEAAAIVALGAYGVPDSEALSCALVIHVVQFLPFVVAGLILLHGTVRIRGNGKPGTLLRG
jgi:glycosyltransferase 2 family protein